MMKKMNLFVCCMATMMFVLPMQSDAQFWKKKKKKQATEKSEVKKESAYDKLIKGAEVNEGMFDIIQKKGKLYLSIPKNLLERDFLLSSRVSKVSDVYKSEAGRMPFYPLLINFSCDTSKVFIQMPQLLEHCDKNSEIYESYKNNHMPAMWKSFKIKCYNNDSTAIVADFSDLFCSGEKILGPFPPARGIAAFMRGKTGSFNRGMSKILSSKSFEKNINIKSRLAYSSSESAFTCEMSRNIIMLPKKQMRVRYFDERIGYFYQRRIEYSSESFQVEPKRIIHRWDIQPKKEDIEKYKNGELVEPEKPIVWYVDRAIPNVWKKYIKAGIEDWQEAFEEIGFKNAIVAKDYPTKEEDPNFDPDDINYNCYRYVTTQVKNSMGPSWVDPRSGEIICGDVLFYSNVSKLLQDWLFVQTGAVDPKVRGTKVDPEIIGSSLRYVAAHEVGHTLGLLHNFGASSAIPVDSLRSPKFTQKHGTTPSIMDYARYNYIAQPGDLEKGVKLTPPKLGVYDKYAIKWGYTPIFDANTAKEEYKTLNKWIVEKKDDPMYHYGEQTFNGILDPTDLSEDLADDPVRAAKYGIKNLRYIMDHFDEWVLEEDKNYDHAVHMIQELSRQYYYYLARIFDFVGGIKIREVVHGDGQERYSEIDAKLQRECVKFIYESCVECSQWLNSKKVQEIVGSALYDANVQCAMMGKLVGLTAPYKLVYNQAIFPNGYRYETYCKDLYNLTFRSSFKGRKLTNGEKDMQTIYVRNLINNVKSILPASIKNKTKLVDTNPNWVGENPFLFDHIERYSFGEEQGEGSVDLEKDNTAKVAILSSMNTQIFKVHKALNRLRKTGNKADRNYYGILFLMLDQYLAK